AGGGRGGGLGQLVLLASHLHVEHRERRCHVGARHRLAVLGDLERKTVRRRGLVWVDDDFQRIPVLLDDGGDRAGPDLRERAALLAEELRRRRQAGEDGGSG